MALNLWEGAQGASPLWLVDDGTFSTDDRAVRGLDAAPALVRAARWISSRRVSTFERLYAPKRGQPSRSERLSTDQARGMLAQVKSVLDEARVGGAAAQQDSLQAAQARSAGLTVLAHLLATALKDPEFRAVADQAADEIFALCDAEKDHETARPALRGHAILLLQLRGPALRDADRTRARALLRNHVRVSPPYDQLKGPWRFAMCADWEFLEGESSILEHEHKWKRIPLPDGTPASPMRRYDAFEAPFKTPEGAPIQVFARSASPRDENHEMASAWFTGILISRHAQLGLFDLRAAEVPVSQHGYKLMMNAQCAGMTTRYAISRLFPDADIYSSWDSTLFNTDKRTGRTIESEGIDCFVALVEAMSKKKTHAQIESAIRDAQWDHGDGEFAGFVQFVGPANPLVVARFTDLNQDGKADLYDGFCDFELRAIAETLADGATPKDPSCAATQISGDAANGLEWAAGSLDRAVKYSEIWSMLPADSEARYVYQAAGFYSHHEPPADVPQGDIEEDLAHLPSVCRYRRGRTAGSLTGEVMMHAWLSHAPRELKRLLVAAEAMRRAFDLNYLQPRGPLETRFGQRAAALLTMAGLLEFAADQNMVDGVWSMALKMLNLPEISRSVVRACFDHDADDYYGSFGGIERLEKTLEASDPVALKKMKSDDPAVGRAKSLAL